MTDDLLAQTIADALTASLLESDGAIDEHTAGCIEDDAQRAATAIRSHGLAVSQDEVAVEVPEIKFPGPKSQADCWREIADRIARGYPAGGSNSTTALYLLLSRVIAPLDSATRTSP